MTDMEKINSILDTIESKQKEIEAIQYEINNDLAKELNDLCKKVILAKFKQGIFVTHRNKYVFKLVEINDCHVYTDSFITLDKKHFFDGEPLVKVCRAVSFIDNARLATEEEIQLYLDSRKEHRKENGNNDYNI